MTPSEVATVLRAYVSRRMYLLATASGGLRFDLDGEVTSQAAAWAQGQIERLDARTAREAKQRAEGCAWIEAHSAARNASEAVERRSDVLHHAPCEKSRVRLSGASVRGLSRADLAAAATARRTAAVDATA